MLSLISFGLKNIQQMARPESMITSNSVSLSLLTLFYDIYYIFLSFLLCSLSYNKARYYNLNELINFKLNAMYYLFYFIMRSNWIIILLSLSSRWIPRTAGLTLRTDIPIFGENQCLLSLEFHRLQDAINN